MSSGDQLATSVEGLVARTSHRLGGHLLPALDPRQVALVVVRQRREPTQRDAPLSPERPQPLAEHPHTTIIPVALLPTGCGQHVTLPPDEADSFH
jgi:hypothetical protein